MGKLGTTKPPSFARLPPARALRWTGRRAGKDHETKDREDTTLRISPVGDFKPQPFTVLGWEVPDLKATVKVLTGAGIEFVRVPGLPQDELGIWSPGPGIFVAWFRDPDGNMLSVAQH